MGFLSLSGVSVAGCSVVDAELRQSGGVVGSTSNNIFSAPTKELQVYRAAIAMALLGSIAQASGAQSQDAEMLVSRLTDTAEDIRNMYKLATYDEPPGNCAALTKVCATYPAEFESRLPHLESRLYHLTVASLSNEELGKLKGDVLSQNYISLAFHFLKAGGSALRQAHQMAATYRSVTEGVALATARSRPQDAGVEIVSVDEAYAYLIKVIGEVGEPQARRDIRLEPQDFDFLFKLALRSCSDIAGRTDGKGDKLRQECAETLKW
ncbi:hypothetical protein [Radicibacter daui]|uniref:hypothetical protein n=1 Tax=Radicibacter daui TaxID=3064829 RepID=UPI004046DA39